MTKVEEKMHNSYDIKEFSQNHFTEEDLKLFHEEDQSMKKDDEQLYGGLGLWLRGQMRLSNKEL